MRTWSLRRLVAVALAAAAVPASLLVLKVIACGPDYEPEVFVTENHPDQPARFVEGHLGILETTYYHAELVIAYRYLSGGKLSATEKAAYVPAMQASDNPYDWDEQHNKAATSAVNEWVSARAAVAPGMSSPAVSENRTVKQKIGTYSYQGRELNCPDGAFVTAAKTLQARAQTWGADSAELKEWLRGQDAVFANCTGAATMPDPPQSEWDAPAAHRRDRAYQIAAANFYAGNYGDAIAEFIAIGKDKGSPWSRWGEYLAARAEVRKAGRNGQTADFGKNATFDNAGLQAAESGLLKIESETADPEIRHAAQTELNFILVRLDPSKRLDAAGAALAGPNPDPDFAQDLADLDVLMDRKTGGDSDLVLWIEDMQGIPPKNGNVSHENITNRWRQKQTLPWLVAALARSPLKAGSDLLSAAAGVQPGSPGYLTVINYRAQQMLVAGNDVAARTLLSTTLASLGPDAMVSTRNQFLSLRMQTARNLNEFLADAPRTIIGSGSENADLARCDTQPADATQQPSETLGCRAPATVRRRRRRRLSEHADAARPVAEQAAEGSALPTHLRQAVAEMAWVRALGLNDTAALARMAKLLPGSMRQIAGVNDDFPATLALLKAPGVRPYLDAGVQRSVSFAELDHFRENWWCGRWTDGSVQMGPNAYSGQTANRLCRRSCF